MTERELFHREMSLRGTPEVTSHLHITYPVWKQFGDKLNWLEDFSEYVQAGVARTPGHPAGSQAPDQWACQWKYPMEALDGICVGFPIADWSDMASYVPPDPDDFTDWGQQSDRIATAHKRGQLASGGTDHGFIFLRLTYLRGFDRALMDMADERPELEELIAIIESYWLEVARRWVEAGVDTINFGDDLGMQHALPIHPETWRRYIRPSYERIFSFCRSHGVHAQLHSDGYIVDIMSDLIDCGISVLNPQDLVNGLDNLRRLARGRVHIRLDLDRQDTTVFGTPEQIDKHVRDCVKQLGSPTGGLSIIWGVYPATPLANIEAVARALDRYATLWRRADKQED